MILLLEFNYFNKHVDRRLCLLTDSLVTSYCLSVPARPERRVSGYYALMNFSNLPPRHQDTKVAQRNFPLPADRRLCLLNEFFEAPSCFRDFVAKKNNRSQAVPTNLFLCDSLVL